MKILTLILFCASLLPSQGNTAAPASGQTARPIGVIIAIDLAARSLTIKTDAGPEMEIACSEATKFLRVAPGAQDLTNAATISASDLTVGDRILARGQSAGDAGLFVATSIIVMTKSDLANKHAADRAEWEKRGISGIITSLNPTGKEITISLSVTSGTKPMVIAFAPGALLRRYAPNSVKFSDARPSRYEDLQVGDQVKALGTASEDRSRFTAEELVSGSFRTIAGTVVSSDPERSTIVITDLSTNKRVQAQITPDSTVRRLSAPVAQMLAARLSGNAGSSGAPSQPQSRDLQSAIEKLPPLSLAELKPGETVILGGTKGEDSSRITAITLLAGVEAALKNSSRSGRTLNLGSWNLDLNINIGTP
jgi:hypothetical protein